MIIGQPGSGKSTLARELGDLLNLPVFYIDRIHWQPGWVEREANEKMRLCAEVHAKDEWIFEGGHSISWGERIARADTLIWLDFPLRIRAWRIIKRTLRHHGKTRPDLPDNCPEHFNFEFTAFVWSTRKTSFNNMLSFYEGVSEGKEKYRVCSRKDIERLMTALS